MDTTNNTAIKQCLNAISTLEDDLARAKRASVFSNADLVAMSRFTTAETLKELRDTLPQAVRTAGGYIDEIDSLREQTRRECEEMNLEAANRANQTIAEANQQAQQVTVAANQQAQQQLATAQAEAQRIVAAARAEHQRILAQAQQQADAMVSEQEVLRRATVAAEELKTKTEEEAAALRKNTFDYLDALLGDADGKLTEIVNNLRREHAELNNNR